jgi:Fe2+ or Zn2+ uptake regulation protein
MYEELKLTHLIKDLEGVIEQFPEHRSGKNSRYELADAGMGAFSVFFTQCPSFLARQQELKLLKGRSNVEKLFELREIPSDNQIRNLLDPVDPTQLGRFYRQTFQGMEEAGLLKSFRSYSNQLLIALDGTEYFSSKKIHCENCNHRILQDGKTNYFHSVLTPVIVQSGDEHVLSLEPEFIVPQDGHEKQDCEIQAGKRWVEKNGDFYAKRGVTMLGDDLYSRQPYCQELKDKHLHFILVCKPDSHATLYETVEFLAAQGVLASKVVRKWNGRYGEIHTYRYANQLALYAEQPVMIVNWCELTSTREDTGEQLYKNAFATDFEITDTTVEAIVRDGRTRWKIENENNNVLKTKGYHIEHNFGHGEQHLAAILLSLNLLAFLLHTILDLVNEQYRAIRHALGRRRTFFQDLEALLRYFFFDTWEDVFSFMFHGLELDSG